MGSKSMSLLLSKLLLGQVQLKMDRVMFLTETTAITAGDFTNCLKASTYLVVSVIRHEE